MDGNDFIQDGYQVVILPISKAKDRYLQEKAKSIGWVFTGGATTPQLNSIYRILVEVVNHFKQ